MKPFETASGLLRDRTEETASGLLRDRMEETASGLLRDRAETDRPIFEEPWQARVFALAVHLSERGVFEWSQFATVLGTRLERSDAPAGADYYHCWHAALVDVLGAVGVRGVLDIEP